ncbi:serine/arginine repetitive matrix protein 3-like [Peromyscus eremicus]|uniref:serine/arginine repetitive matrix protein 3-like n=1 Tax=Peromyscus eremicus TaxID=42410 RepID=UPI0027DAD8EC|nr:serine/arginine repetitive matrix protein 3-like [Peromyscus eremicus]
MRVSPTPTWPQWSSPFKGPAGWCSRSGLAPGVRTCGISVIPAVEEGGAGGSGLSTLEPGGPGKRSAFHLFSGAFISSGERDFGGARKVPLVLPREEGGGAGNGHVQPPWRRRLACSPGTALAVAWLRTDASARNVARRLGDGDEAGDAGTGGRVGVETCPGQGNVLREEAAEATGLRNGVRNGQNLLPLGGLASEASVRLSVAYGFMYSKEEIRQKVGTFRQMLMEKEGVLTREDRPGAHIVAETPRRMDGLEPGLEYPPFDEDDGPVDCDCPVACYRGHRGYRTKHWSSSSASPPPKKKKKKKGSHRRSRKKRRLESECSCGSASPLRKKKKGVKKHRRDRSDSGSRRKRRYRSRSLKSKRKERNKERKRPHTESPGRRAHHHSSVSSHCPSMTSHYSDSGSPSRLSPKHRDDGRKTGNQRSSGSRSPSPSGGSGWGSPQQNGGSRQRSGAHGGRPGSAHSPPDKPSSPRACDKVAAAPTPPARGKDSQSPRSVPSSQGRGGRAAGGAARRRRRRRRRRRSRSSANAPRRRGRRRAKPAPPRGSSRSLSGAHSSSESGGGAPGPGPEPGSERGHSGHGKRAKERPPRARPTSTSPSPGAHGRRGGPEGNSSSRSPGPHPGSWSSSRSPSKSRSRSPDKRTRSPSLSPSPKKPLGRDKDSEGRARHAEAEAARTRRRSRSYSPIRKRRRDSPSFMEPRRITSARKHPIPYYRPSPSSSSSCLSSDYSSRSHSRSPSPGHSHGSYSSRSHGTRSRSCSASRSRSPSYHSSSESGGF